ncbi:hypothetical protein MKX03_009119 [Papaver bracteatum]|nr:hypothetical protein MKX03_009119 [Papaver bracteatum]
MMQQSGENLSQQPIAQVTKLQVIADTGFLVQFPTVLQLQLLCLGLQQQQLGQVAVPPCNWTEHTFPEGYKYYYNSVTSESRFQSQSQSLSQLHLSTKQGPQSQQSQIQSQMLSCGLGLQEPCYAQSQVSANAGGVPARPSRFRYMSGHGRTNLQEHHLEEKGF